MRHSAALVFAAVLNLSVSACGAGKDAQAQSIPHPDDPGKRVEFFVSRPAGAGPWPAVVFLHGHQDGARPGAKAFVAWGVLDRFARRGYLAVAVSLPGYGNSSGPADFCGPLSQHAVLAVLSTLRASGEAAPDKVALEGISRGAIVAGLVAARDPSIAAIVLISGVYDLPRYVADSKALDGTSRRNAVVRSIVEETSGSESALKERSVLEAARQIKASALILNGLRDDRTDPKQAERLAEAIRSNGGSARAIVYPAFGHQIPVEIRDQEIDPFLDGILRK